MNDLNPEWDDYENDAKTGLPTWLGTIDAADDDDPLLVMVAPANDAGDLYGWYTDSNPTFAFDRDMLAGVLAMRPADAVTWLSGRVSPEAQRRGCPFYV